MGIDPVAVDGLQRGPQCALPADLEVVKPHLFGVGCGHGRSHIRSDESQYGGR